MYGVNPQLVYLYTVLRVLLQYARCTVLLQTLLSPGRRHVFGALMIRVGPGLVPTWLRACGAWLVPSKMGLRQVGAQQGAFLGRSTATPSAGPVGSCGW